MAATGGSTPTPTGALLASSTFTASDAAAPGVLTLTGASLGSVGTLALAGDTVYMFVVYGASNVGTFHNNYGPTTAGNLGNGLTIGYDYYTLNFNYFAAGTGTDPTSTSYTTSSRYGLPIYLA